MLCVYLGIAACRRLSPSAISSEMAGTPTTGQASGRASAQQPLDPPVGSSSLCIGIGPCPERTVDRVASLRSGGATHGTELRRRPSQAP